MKKNKLQKGLQKQQSFIFFNLILVLFYIQGTLVFVITCVQWFFGVQSIIYTILNFLLTFFLFHYGVSKENNVRLYFQSGRESLYNIVLYFSLVLTIIFSTIYLTSLLGIVELESIIDSIIESLFTSAQCADAEGNPLDLVLDPTQIYIAPVGDEFTIAANNTENVGNQGGQNGLRNIVVAISISAVFFFLKNGSTEYLPPIKQIFDSWWSTKSLCSQPDSILELKSKVDFLEKENHKLNLESQTLLGLQSKVNSLELKFDSADLINKKLAAGVSMTGKDTSVYQAFLVSTATAMSVFPLIKSTLGDTFWCEHFKLEPPVKLLAQKILENPTKFHIVQTGIGLIIFIIFNH